MPLIENVRVDGDRFNEAIADATGRVLVGTVRNGRPNGAGIYRLESSGTLAKVLGGTGQSNGMGWNAKGDALYWTCGTTKTICRCKYDAKRGALTNRQVFHECMPEEGTPAGLAVDVEGTLWSARREPGSILKIGENRRLMGQVTFPAQARHLARLRRRGPSHRLRRRHRGGGPIEDLHAPVARRRRAPAPRSKIERRESLNRLAPGTTFAASPSG